jgi:hypothetical protein
MRRALLTAVFALAILIPAQSALGAEEFDKYAVESVSGSLSTTQAGAHPDVTTSFALSEKEGKPYARTRDVIVTLPAGFFGNPHAFPTCTSVQLGREISESECPFDSQVGSMDITLGGGIAKGTIENEPIYNMAVLGGNEVARFGFFAGIYQAALSVRLDPESHRVIASVEGAPSLAEFISSEATFWGVPSDPSHDIERITPEEVLKNSAPAGGRKSSLSGETPFMTNPTRCEGSMEVSVTARSYQLPSQPSTKTGTYPAITGCGAVEFNPDITLKPTTTQGTTGTGLDADVSFPTKGLQFGKLTYGSEAKRVEVTLPEGMTVNPSEAEGLGVCSEADLAKETYNSAPNAGCPETSKIGSVEASTPVIDRNAVGSLYLAKPYQNPFNSLLALYMVLKVPDRGVLVKMAGRVTTDPQTGQITTVFDDVPQLPVATFHLHFREGARAPLITPAACGSYDAVSNFTPWSAPGKVTQRTSSFEIESGPNHGPCPNGGLPPFKPGLLAGTINNAAGTFSPFNVKLTRTDAEQEITHFSIKLPPGIVAKLAGVPYCPDSAIEAAKARTGPHGGEEELNAPSCPAASEIGHSLAGAGVGSVLTYVPGKVYLAGPYHGSKMSIVAITAAKAGPFDLGTVVVREALQINPETAEVFIDATGSDPIPHIIQGIPVHLRDIRAYVDRPEFSLNPTDCTATSTASTVLGSGLDFVSEADDNPITVSSPFQAADCAALPFKPQLGLRLIGHTNRGAHPAFKAHLQMNGIGEAGIAYSQVTLPKSEFIENAHFNTICTRVQFKAGNGNGEQCPSGSIYGHAKATTPILSEPLEGPVFLRSSEHELPDLVVALHNSQVDFDLVGRVDSVKGGGLRNTFETAPDAPVSSFDLEMEGGAKGLFVNSANLCAKAHRAKSVFIGQNGRRYETKPKLAVRCKGQKHKKAHRRHRRAHRKAAGR